MQPKLEDVFLVEQGNTLVCIKRRAVFFVEVVTQLRNAQRYVCNNLPATQPELVNDQHCRVKRLAATRFAADELDAHIALSTVTRVILRSHTYPQIDRPKINPAVTQP